MEITSKGITAYTLTDYLAKWTEYLKSKYGNDFFIKPEGVIDNLAVGVSASCLDFESILLFIAKNMNPYTAEGEFQDFLYSQIGLERRQATFTVIQRTVQGEAGATYEKGSITIKNDLTEDQFVLNDDLQININGVGVGSFIAIESGAIDIEDDALISVVSSPATVSGVYFTIGNEKSVGVDYESDAEFRDRWIQNQSTISSATDGGIKAALLPYCDNNTNNIKIRMNRNTVIYNDVPLHSQNIVVNSAYDDETIANVILSKITDGVGLAGDIEQTVLDSEGNEETILFSRATIVPIYFNIKVVLDDNITLDQVKSTIIDEIKTLRFAMGDDVIANKSIPLVDAINGVNYVDTIQVSDDNNTWVNVFEIDEIELAEIEGVNVES